MRNIKVITGYLKVSRSFALVSLHFFKSLELIKNSGNEKFSITIMENDNLQKLFQGKPKVESGKAFIHYNQKLCMEEINSFLETSGIEKPGAYEVSNVTNGNKAVCSKEKLRFEISQIGGQMVSYTMQNYRNNLQDLLTEDVNALIGYEIYYREISEEQFASKNISKFEGLDACKGIGNAWNVQDRRPSEVPPVTNISPPKMENTFPKIPYEDEKGFIMDLKPYTTYAFYATTLMVPHLATNATGAQSDIVYIRTATVPPDKVRSLQWMAASHSSLRVSWLPPSRPHGIIDHYDIFLDYIPLVEIAKNRNYCTKKSVFDVDKVVPKDVIKKLKPTVNGTDNCPLCKCSADDAKSTKIVDFGDKHIEEQEFYSDLINKIFTIPVVSDSSVVSDRTRRSIDNGESGNTVNSEDKEAIHPDYVVVKTMIQGHGIPAFENLYNETALVNGSNVYSIVYKQIPGNQTEVLIEGLKHFALYQVKVMACQKEYMRNPACKKNCEMQKDCSPWAIVEAKTLNKLRADDIPLVDSKLVVYHANETTGDTFIRWEPPQDPNEMISHYILRSASSLGDETNKIFNEMCIPLTQLRELEDGWLEYQLKEEGEYWISLRAVSLHSPGAWTTWQWVKVNTNSSYTWIIVLVVVLIVVAAALMSGAIFQHKKKHPGETQWEIVSRNPDYLDTVI